MFKIKKKVDGTADHYKVQLVAQGYAQKVGLDFQDTFSPIAKACTIWTIIASVVTHKWSLQQIDINNTFLNGDLMEEPPGFEQVGVNRKLLACRLHKSLYRLKHVHLNAS